MYLKPFQVVHSFTSRGCKANGYEDLRGLTFIDAMQVRTLSGFAISCCDLRSTQTEWSGSWFTAEVTFVTTRCKLSDLNVAILVLLNVIIQGK